MDRPQGAVDENMFALWMVPAGSSVWGLAARLETARYRLGQYLDGLLPAIPELEVTRYEKDRCGQFLGNGIWKTYAGTATLSDG